MTAFLFIPTASGGKLARRVDFNDLASLFADHEEPTVQTRSRGALMRVVAFLMILIFAVGDTILIARPYGLMHAWPTQSAAARALTNL